MGSYKDMMIGTKPDAGAWLGLLPSLEKTCPNVRDMLMGIYDDLGNQTFKGGSLTFWLDGAKLKFVVRPKDQGLLGWGVCKDCCNPFESIELALMEDQIDWKESVNKGATDAPY